MLKVSASGYRSVISPQHEHTWPLGHRMSGRGGSLTNAVAVARPVLQDVDVQVLGMRRIGPWAEYRVDSGRKRDHLEFDSGGAETIQAGLVDGGRPLSLFRWREVVWSGMGGRLGRARRWQWWGRGSVTRWRLAAGRRVVR